MRSTHLSDDAVLHQDDLVRDGHGFALVMRYVDGRDAQLLLDAADLRAHLYTQLGVKVGQGLIKQQNAGFYDQGAGKCDTLLLAAGELVGHTLFHTGQFDQCQDIGHAALDLVLGDLAQAQAVRNVVKHIVVWEQGIALEYHRCIALVGGQLIDRFSAEVNLAFVRAFKARDHTQGSGLAASGRTQQCHE